jgi:hypothetical protein
MSPFQRVRGRASNSAQVQLLRGFDPSRRVKLQRAGIAAPTAYLLAEGYDDYTTNVPVADLTEGKAMDFDHLVTQWMSPFQRVRGRASNSAQVQLLRGFDHRLGGRDDRRPAGGGRDRGADRLPAGGGLRRLHRVRGRASNSAQVQLLRGFDPSRRVKLQRAGSMRGIIDGEAG